MIRIMKPSRMSLAGHVARMRRIGMGRHWLKEDNVKMDLREIGWIRIHWIDLTQNRDQWRGLVNTATNLRVPQNIGKFHRMLVK
jgi:hypothetical protein